MGDVNFQTLTVPGLKDFESDALNRNLKLRLVHRPRNYKRSCLYDGKNAMQRSTVVPEQYYRMGIALGWSGKAVDALTRRTQLQRFTWADGDLGSLGMDALERENFMRSEIQQALTDSGLHGVSFLISTQGLDGEPRSLIHARDALNAYAPPHARPRPATGG